MTIVELRNHCEKQVQSCEEWAHMKGEQPSGHIYEEHKMILELLDSLKSVRAEIDWEEEWLKRAGYDAYNVSLAFDHLKHVCNEMEESDNEQI